METLSNKREKYGGQKHLDKRYGKWEYWEKRNKDGEWEHDKRKINCRKKAWTKFRIQGKGDIYIF